jgi:tRNA pseudouridine32 synthase/23S rRNA pseudouridine746 synthase
MVEHLGEGLYRLTPRTGRTHQLRVHMASLGLPIENDPWYPNVIDVAPDDFTRPLKLLAHRLAFTDPVGGDRREFISRRTLVSDGPPTPSPPRSPPGFGPPPPQYPS